MKAKKTIKVIFIILLAAVIILAGVAMLFKFFGKKHILDGPGMINTREGELTGLCYSCGGGMDGEYTMYRLTEQADRTVLFEYEYTPPLVHETTESKSCVLPEGTLDPFRLICRNTQCLINAAYGKEREEQLLDAPTTNITFYLGDTEVTIVTMHDSYDYPESCNGVFSDIVKQFKQLLETAEQ
ncbi:MAG: hypothetical protein E7484_04365 [Ruminococcaceae bacterium]|nr:hypothetical protein [Oscillospiraceae bacterium]